MGQRVDEYGRLTRGRGTRADRGCSGSVGAAGAMVVGAMVVGEGAKIIGGMGGKRQPQAPKRQPQALGTQRGKPRQMQVIGLRRRQPQAPKD